MFHESDSAIPQQGPNVKGFRRASQAALSSHSCWLKQHCPTPPSPTTRSYHTAAALLSAEKVPMHVRFHTEQSDCGSSAFAHIFTIIQYELIVIKLLLQQLTIVPEALQFQDIPINTQ